MYNTIGTGSSLALYLVTSHYSSFPFFPKTRVFMLCWQNVSCAFILYPPYCSSLGHNCKSLYNPPQQAFHSRSSLKKISVSQGCYNTLSQTGCFITIEMCSLSSGGQKSKCQQGRASSCKGLQEESFLDSCGISWLPAILSILWVVVVATPKSASAITWLSSFNVCPCPEFPLLIRTPVIVSGPPCVQYDLILFISGKTIFPNEVRFTGSQ